jgi:hypothetical protein
MPLSLLRLLAILLCFGAFAARADTITVGSAELRAEDENYVLNAEFDLAFNPTLEQALQRGVALYFVFEFELSRPRWYWFDERAASLQINYRVHYNALTRQYRLSSGLYTQDVDTIDGVVRLLSRVRGRPVVDKSALVKGERYEAAVRLRLDVNRLPKPFQLNALASRDWNLQSDWQRWTFVP